MTAILMKMAVTARIHGMALNHKTLLAHPFAGAGEKGLAVLSGS